jgi:predicted TPR repeat methyltransferase
MIQNWLPDAYAEITEDIFIDSFDLASRHPWHHARTNLLLALLRSLDIHPPADILDVGCAWGLTLDALERKGYEVAGLDISRRALARVDRPGRDLIAADITRPLPQNARQYSVVIALDLIEHLDDDRAAILQLAQLTKPAGLIIISVPALPDLFSYFDAVQGHRRRYLPDTLRQACSGNGLIVEQIFWWGSWLIPLLRIQRKRSRTSNAISPSEIYRRYLALPSRPISLVLRLAFALDQKRTLQGKARVGTSLFAVVRCRR